MTRKNEIQKELENLSPSLAKLKSAGQKEHSMLPDGYFESLSEIVESKIFDEQVIVKQQKSKIVKLWWFAGAAIAACVALFFLTNTSNLSIEYPQLEPLTLNEQLVVEELDVFDMEYLLELESYTEEIDAEDLLLDENNLEDLINI
ncbi:MAG: hypothetical protein JXQ87_03910 [Bacteroidia bacterium]